MIKINKINNAFERLQIIGIAFLGGGLFLKFGQTILMPTMSSLLDGALSQAKASGVSTGSVDDFVGIFNIAAYVLIALGAFCFLVALCGCAGACCSVKCFLGFVSTVLICSLNWRKPI